MSVKSVVLSFFGVQKRGIPTEIYHKRRMTKADWELYNKEEWPQTLEELRKFNQILEECII